MSPKRCISPFKLGCLCAAFATSLHAALAVWFINETPLVLPVPPKTLSVSLLSPPMPVPEPRATAPTPPEPVVPPTPKVEKTPPRPKMQKLSPRVEKAPAPATHSESALSAPTPAPDPGPVENHAPAPVVASASAPAPASNSTPAPSSPPRFDAAYLQNPAPAYPSMSKRLGEAGKVLLRVRVSENGQAESVEIKHSSGFPRLDQAALNAVEKWRFVPAKQGDQTIAAWVQVPIHFNLEESSGA